MKIHHRPLASECRRPLGFNRLEPSGARWYGWISDPPACAVDLDTLPIQVHEDPRRKLKIYTQPERSVTATYLDVAVLTMGLAGFQGWLGGELVYSHGVFVKRAARRARPEANPQPAQSHQHH